MAANATATTERVSSAAERAFSRRGFDGARLEDIAKDAGISRPSLLYHYKTKQALYAAVVRGVFADLGEVLEASFVGAASFPERLDRVLTAFLDFVGNRVEAPRLILREILDDRGEGRALLLEAGVPILEMVERFVRDEGREHVPRDLPVRAALLQLVSSTFVKTASGPLEAALWPGEDQTKALARFLFLRSSE